MPKILFLVFTLEASKKKYLHEALRGEGGGQSDHPPPSTFDTIHRINVKLGTSFVLSIKLNHVVSNWFPWQR